VPSVSPALLVKLVMFVDIQDLTIWFASGLHLPVQVLRDYRLDLVSRH
jgi:hypothetical protein